MVAGFRWHKSGRDAVGSLLLGPHDERDVLHHVGVTFDMPTRRALARELDPLRERALEAHPWAGREQSEGQDDGQRMPGARSRWSAGKNLSWKPLRIERVSEVKYDHLQGDRFRHATVFLRWRFDRPPRECRNDQLESTPPHELAHVFRPVSADR